MLSTPILNPVGDMSKGQKKDLGYNYLVYMARRLKARGKVKDCVGSMERGNDRGRQLMSEVFGRSLQVS